MDPFEIYGFARIDDWLAAHESFAASLDEHSWLGGLIGIYRDRVLAVRGEVTIRRGKQESIETPRMQVLIGYVDSMAQEIEKMQSDVELGRVDQGRRQASRAGNAAKKEKKDRRIRQVAKSYKHFTTLHPDWLASMIYEHVRAALNIPERTFQGYLADARTQGLIPRRHRRIPR